MVYYNLLYLLFTYELTRSPFNPISHYERSTSIKESYGENYILPSWLGFFYFISMGLHESLHVFFDLFIFSLYFWNIYGLHTLEIDHTTKQEKIHIQYFLWVAAVWRLRKMFFVLSQAWDKEKNSECPWGAHGNSESLSHARDKTKNIFLDFFTELKTYYLSYFIYERRSCMNIFVSRHNWLTMMFGIYLHAHLYVIIYNVFIGE